MKEINAPVGCGLRLNATSELNPVLRVIPRSTDRRRLVSPDVKGVDVVASAY
jgi:hypothetical protein